MAPQRTPVLAMNSLRLGDRAKIKAKRGDGSAPVVNTGSAYTQVGAEAASGDLWSKAATTIADRVRIEGSVRVSSTLSLGNDVVVTGDSNSNTPLGALRESSWAPVVPVNTEGNVTLEPSQTRVVVPGGYGFVSVKEGASLKLSSGTYAFDGDVTVEPGGKLVIDDAEGPVVAYVRGTGITFRGVVEKQSEPTSSKVDLLFVVLGPGASFVEPPFRGTIFAPKGSVTLQPLNGAGEHVGAFFARDLNVEAGVTVRHRPFPWSKVLPPGIIEMKDAPIRLKPVADGPDGEPGDVEVTPPEPVVFEIPRDIWVTVGNAGHGTFKLSFRSPQGVTTVCTYTGGSPVAAPITDLDRAKGLRYTFPSCTNGFEHGQSTTADWFRAEIVSDATNQDRTAVSLDLGKGCSGSLPAALSPEEVVAIRDNFNWHTTGALPETDSEGRAALWHGLIYVDRPEQLQALNLWRVFWSTMPISDSYAAGLRGKCGRVEHATDSEGVMVYAIFPAKLFNILRTFSIEAALKNAAPPFKAIVPSSPGDPGYLNPDGSIKYSALASAGFKEWLAAGVEQQPWFGEDLVNWAGDALEDAGDWIDDNIIDPAGEVADSGFSYVTSGWDEAVDWVAGAIDDTWEGIQVGLAEFVGLFEDRVEVTLNFRMQNRDPLLFDNRMQRTWGSEFGKEIVPHGIYTNIRQWGWGFLPALTREKLPEGGTVKLDVLEGASGSGGNGLCFELDNDDAMMSSDFAPNEVCDFDGPMFEDFEHDTTNDVVVFQKDLHALTQVVDSADYVRTVMGWEPHKMDILIGWAANGMTSLLNGSPRAMCLCLDFPGVGAGAISTIGDLLGPVTAGTGNIAASLLLKDLWWPDDSEPSVDSRGVMTHEYGHFTMCSLLFDKASGETGLGGPTALTKLIGRIAEGNDPNNRNRPIALVTESWADSFAMQVVGGSNYLRVDNATNPNNLDYSMGFCTAPDCMDWNYQGTNDYPFNGNFYDELAKFESTIHDAFDRSDDSRRLTDQPWNGDVWQYGVSGQLVLSASSYLAVDDEPASLSGVGWQFWVEKWLARGGSPNREDYFGGLSDAMAQQGNSWCDRCEVFAVHEFMMTDAAGNPVGAPSLYVPVTFGDHFSRWQLCAGEDGLSAILGDPPSAHLNLDASCTACGPLEFSDAGTCTSCPASEVPRGDHCEPCPDGTVPDLTNECVECGPLEISTEGVCEQCPFGTAPDRSTNTCVECAADAVVDVSGAPSSCEATALVTTTTTPEAGDSCPWSYYVDVVNLDSVIAAGCSGVSIDVRPAGSLDAATCPNRVVQTVVYDGSWNLLESKGADGTWIPGTCPPPSPSEPICLDPPRCEFGVSFTIDEESIEDGLDRVRLDVTALDVTDWENSSDVPAEVRVFTFGSAGPPK
jgi:hypothetical protein